MAEIEGSKNSVSIARSSEKEEKVVSREEENILDVDISLQEMAEAGLHLGHKTSRVHPKMRPYIYGIRNTVHIIDLEKSKEKLKEALLFIKELISENKILLLIGTKIQVKDLVKDIAESCNLPYINERWLGGFFTNFGTIKKRIEYFKELEERRKKGDLKKYTKKERAKIDKELRELEIKFGGIKKLEKLPEAIFVLNMKKDDLAIKEAKRKGIKVIAIADTNVDPTKADYPIPANDDAISAVKYILEKVKEAILKTKQKAEAKKKKHRRKSEKPRAIKKKKKINGLSAVCYY